MSMLTDAQACELACIYARVMSYKNRNHGLCEYKDYDDYYQDAYVEMLRSGTGNFQSTNINWLRNKEYRVKSRRPFLVSSGLNILFEEAPPRQEQQIIWKDQLEKFWAKLDDRERIVFHSYIKEIPTKKIAEDIGRTKVTVSSIMNLLRCLFKELGNE